MTAASPAQRRLAEWRLDEVLQRYPGLRIVPKSSDVLVLAGRLGFVAQPRRLEAIEDEYSITMTVPRGFPFAIPQVWEMSNRIPRDFHTMTDGSLCLGSSMRLRLLLAKSPSLLTFVDRCVIPYLYGRSYFEKYGVMAFGELKHGAPGVRQDLASIFGVDEESDVGAFVGLASMKRREANKRACPCGGARRLGRCHHRKVNAARAALGRKWFRLPAMGM